MTIIKPTLKPIFLQAVENIVKDTKDIAIALSAGIDSTCILFALLELNKNITAYTLHVDGVESQDLLYAKANAELFKINFVPCVIPSILNKDLVSKIIIQYDKYKKTDVECIYPFFYLLPKVKEQILITGSCSDGHFCLSKKGMIHYKHTIEKIQEFRNGLFSNPDYAQAATLAKIAKNEFNIKLDNPYNKSEMVEYFFDKSWNEINKPHQKQPLLDLFPEQFAKIKVFNHTNLQCGDSQIRELFEQLFADKNINFRNRKRVIDIYRDIHNKVGELI